MRTYVQEYYKTQISNAKNNGVKKIPMLGMYNDVVKIKSALEMVADIVYHLDCCKTDAFFMGWDPGNQEVISMWKTADLIQEEFAKLYGIVCAATEDEE